MDGVVAHDALEPARHVDDLLRLRLGVVGLAQVRAGRHALVEARRASHDRLGDQLREPVAGRVVHAQHARGVACRGAGLHLAEGDDLRDRVTAVLLLHVPDHALAAPDREVDVDVRHRLALGVQEPLEQQVHVERVDVGDAQDVADDRAGRRSTTGTDGDPVVLGVLDEVPDDQEVRLEAHVLDHGELGLEPFERGGRRRIAVALAQPLLGQPAQVGGGRRAVGRRIRRQHHAVELQLDVAALGDLERGGNRLGPLLRTTRPSRPGSSGRTRWCRSAASAARGSTWSARTAAPSASSSPRGAGSARRRYRPAAGRARARSARCPRSPGPAPGSCCSAPRSRRCPRRTRP